MPAAAPRAPSEPARAALVEREGLLESLEATFSLGVARGFLSDPDLEAIPDAIALLPFELGLRFLTDHLAGDVYFRTERPGHNLDRALVQFRLAASVERQRDAIQALVEKL
jgi:hypothetical protein